jgi:hypothetical protein
MVNERLILVGATDRRSKDIHVDELGEALPHDRSCGSLIMQTQVAQSKLKYCSTRMPGRKRVNTGGRRSITPVLGLASSFHVLIFEEWILVPWLTPHVLGASHEGSSHSFSLRLW